MPFKSLSYTFAISLLLGIIALYFTASFFSLPYADDFCFGWTNQTKGDVLTRYLLLYQNWNGRYTSDLLIQFHPITTNSLIAYQLPSAIAILLTVFSYIMLAKTIGASLMNSILVGCTLATTNLTLMPAISDCLFWFGGLVNYHLGVILLYVHISLLLQYFKEKLFIKWLCLAVSWLLLIAVVGIHELAAIVVTTVYISASILYRNHKSIRTIIWLFTVTAIAGLLVVVMAPGNAVRSGHFSNQYNLAYSLFYTGAQMVRFGLTWIFNPPFIILAYLTYLYGNKIIHPQTIAPHFRLLIVTLLSSLFLAFFIPYFATGLLGQHRTAAFAFALFLPTSLLLIIYYSNKYGWWNKYISTKTLNRNVLAILFFVGTLLWGNTRTIIVDFASGRMATYKNIFLNRQKQILNNPQVPIEPLQVVPNTFHIADTKGDTTYWVDQCMKNFYLTSKKEIH